MKCSRKALKIELIYNTLHIEKVSYTLKKLPNALSTEEYNAGALIG